jgi:hypothetical protein
VQFRWLVLISLWTCLSGPVFGGAGAAPRTADKATASPTSVRSAHHGAARR